MDVEWWTEREREREMIVLRSFCGRAKRNSRTCSAIEFHFPILLNKLPMDDEWWCGRAKMSWIQWNGYNDWENSHLLSIMDIIFYSQWFVIWNALSSIRPPWPDDNTDIIVLWMTQKISWNRGTGFAVFSTCNAAWCINSGEFSK